MAARDPEVFVREVTRRIAAARRVAGLTQESAAQRYGTALTNWQRFEAGQNITLHTLARIAATLGATPKDLVDDGGKGAQKTTAAGKPRERATPARASSKGATRGAPARPIAVSPPKRKTSAKKKAANKGWRSAAN